MPDGRRPVDARPAAWLVAVLGQLLVGRVPVGPLPAELLAEVRPQVLLAAVGRPEAELPLRLALLAGQVDVVVLGVALAGPVPDELRAGVVRAEAAHVQPPAVPLRRALDDPLGHGLAQAAGARQAVGAEGAGHPEAATSVGPSRNSPSGVKPSGPLSSWMISAFSTAGTRRIEFSISGVKRSQSGGKQLVLELAGDVAHLQGARVLLVAAGDEAARLPRASRPGGPGRASSGRCGPGPRPAW